MLLPERDVRTPGVGASGSTRARALNPTIPDPEQLVLRTTSLSCIPCFMMLPGFLRDIPEIYISRTTFGGSISASFLNSFNVTTALDYSWNSLKGNCQYTSILSQCRSSSQESTHAWARRTDGSTSSWARRSLNPRPTLTYVASI